MPCGSLLRFFEKRFLHPEPNIFVRVLNAQFFSHFNQRISFAMKKAIFLFAILFGLGLTAANAQTCHGSAAAAGKSCCASKASKAAAADATIEKRMADDGSVSYVRKQTDTQGNVQFVSVQFDEATNAFVNAAPKGAACTDGMVKKSACSSAEKKSCGSGSGKSCCAGKAKATSMSEAAPAPAPTNQQ